MVDAKHPILSISRQCELLGLSRSVFYFHPTMDSIYNLQRCAFPPCTNSFPKPKNGKKYCSGCCRTKDCNRRKRLQEKLSVVPVNSGESKPSTVEPFSLYGPSLIPVQPVNAQPVPKGGMSLAGVGESAIGTAGVLFMKDQLFDKDHRNQLQQQMNQLLQQQAMISKQIQELNKKVDQLSKERESPSWAEKLLM